jgi:hypothetical protein
MKITEEYIARKIQEWKDNKFLTDEMRSNLEMHLRIKMELERIESELAEPE